MTIYEFKEHFPDDHSCKMEMKRRREREGMTCKKCVKKDVHFLVNRYQWHCNHCKYRTSIKSVTVVHDSKLLVRVWYQYMMLMIITNKAISAHEIRRQLGLKKLPARMGDDAQGQGCNG